MNKSTNTYIQNAKEVIDIEVEALLTMKSNLNESIKNVCEICLQCQGRIIVTGIGKSGHIAKKIAATLASTGSPSFFVHPAEAYHGDIGMITKKDVILALSFSGETKEILSLLPVIQSLDIPLISITGKPTSTLAQKSSAHLNVAIPKEACPLGLAPTASTTNSLVIGDVLAICLLKQKNFSHIDFARSHPGGSLGKKLTLRLADIMHTEQLIPKVSASCTLTRALLEITDKRLGMTCVIDTNNNQLLGVFTDGDLRRAIDKGIDLHSTKTAEVMSTSAITASANTLVTDAITIMHKNRITTIVITTVEGQVVGIAHLHDLLQTGITV